MTKSELNNRLSAALGQEISPFTFTNFCSCFAEHAHYLARFYKISEKNVRAPAKLRTAHELNEQETWLLCLYAGYNLTQEKPTPLW